MRKLTTVLMSMALAVVSAPALADGLHRPPERQEPHCGGAHRLHVPGRGINDSPAWRI